MGPGYVKIPSGIPHSHESHVIWVLGPAISHNILDIEDPGKRVTVSGCHTQQYVKISVSWHGSREKGESNNLSPELSSTSASPHCKDQAEEENHFI